MENEASKPIAPIQKGLTVLMISSDRNIFKQGSAVRARMVEYGTLFTNLHIIVFSQSGLGFQPEQIAPNVFAYPTSSASKWSYVSDAKKIGAVLLGKITNLYSKIEHIVIDVQDPFESALVGRYLSSKFRLPYNVQVHTDFLSPYFRSESWLNKIRVALAKGALAKASRIRVVSERIKASLVYTYRIAPQKISVMPIFVDAQKIVEYKAPFDLRARYAQFQFRIVMASRLEPEKNIEFAFHVLKEVQKLFPRTGLVLIGDGSQKNHLMHLAAKMGLSGSVVFEPWQDSLLPYFKSGDLFLSTSLYEGYGMTLIEAALSGIPILVSDVGIVSDVLVDEVSAFVCPVSSTDCFVRKMLTLIDNKDKREFLAKNALAAAMEKAYKGKDEYLQKYKTNLLACADPSVLIG